MNLEEIKKRCENATPGPWLLDRDMERVKYAVEDSVGVQLWNPSNQHWNNGNTYDDANFIAHAREDVPALVQEVERLQEAKAQLEADAYLDAEEIKGLQAENAALRDALKVANAVRRQEFLDGLDNLVNFIPKIGSEP